MDIPFQTGIAISPKPTAFGPVLFTGRLEQGLKTLNKHGFKFVELSLRTINDVDIDQLKNLLKEMDLSVSAIATGQACLFDYLCLCAADDVLRHKAVDHLKDIIKYAGIIDSPRVIVGGIRGRLVGSTSEQARQYELGVDAIRDAAEFAGENGITLLIEPINRYETNWIFTVEDGLKVLKEIEVPSAKLLLDTFHMNIEEPSFKDAILKCGENLGYVHFADNTRHAPGQGQINFNEIINALLQIGFKGPVISEILPLPDDSTAIQQTAEFWQSI